MRSSASVSRACHWNKHYEERITNFFLTVADVGQEGMVGAYAGDPAMRD